MLRIAQGASILLLMIKSFTHKGLQKFFETGSKAGIQPRHAERLRLQLTALHTARYISDMDMPGWKLHDLTGNRQNTWSITVNKNWRITFEFRDGDAWIVDYEDYH